MHRLMNKIAKKKEVKTDWENNKTEKHEKRM